MSRLQRIRLLFRTITAEEKRVIELAEARSSLQDALTQLDYANSVVKYHQDRVKRLTKEIDSDRSET